MFGKNEIVGRKLFTDSPEAGDGKLLVTSIFYTLQGEGPLTGRPAIFIRLAKCNLNCHFCDAYFDTGEWMTLEDLTNEIETILEARKAPSSYTENPVLVITGGEPLLQPNLKHLLSWANARFQHVQIETNGILSGEGIVGLSTSMVVSPKVSESSGNYLKPHEGVLGQARTLKFVISSDPSSPYHTIPGWAFQWLHGHELLRRVYVSPLNVYKDTSKVTTDEVASFWDKDLIDWDVAKKNHEYTARYALDNNLIFTMQTHLFASLA